MNNENPKQQLIDEYIKKVNNTPDIELNQDQKELIKEILTKIDPKYIQNAYQMLNQRVKIGFTFDEAPSTSKTNIALLVKDEKRSFTNNVMNASDFENSLIIGENYDALKNLIQIEKIRAMTGGGHSDFDIIYIDPPYNTESAKTDGNVSANNNENISASKFIYRDKFSRNGWLNMMKERLIMARQLLKEDGVIFVSIDDNEQAYLKVLMDEIFGEENFISNLNWVRNPGGQSDNKFIAKTYEHILFYAKNISKFEINNSTENIDILDYKYDSINKFYWNKGLPIEKGGNSDLLFDRKNMGYVIYYNKEKNDVIIKFDYDKEKITKDMTIDNQIYNFDKKLIENKYIPIIPRYIRNNYGRWRWSNITFLNYFKENRVIFEVKENKCRVYEKNIVPYDNYFKEYKPKDFISFTSNSSATIELKNILKDFVFNNPKPSELIKYLINFNPNKNARVLDFFAGSGTTGHAVLELNREDGGFRTYTLVTNNENNIGSNVTYERLYRINNGKGTKGETDFKWLEKNDPYKQNLNVYNIEYFDTSIDKIEKDESDDVSLKLLKKLDELLNSLNIKSTEINNEQKLNILTELNALDKKETTNESK